MSTVVQVIKDHLVQEFLDEMPDFELTDDTNLIQEGIVDSLGIFLLIAFLEREFKIEIEADEVVLGNFETPRAISGLVDAKSPSAASP